MMLVHLKKLLHNIGFSNETLVPQKKLIITKNAIHGGVESLIKIESDFLNADVIVAGGFKDPYGTCPFEYSYISDYESLLDELKKYDVVLYHYPPSWALLAIRDAGIPSVEFVHMIETSDCDKSVPFSIITHSKYVQEYMKKKYYVDSIVAPNTLDIKKFKPSDNKNKYIGAVVAYSKIKGIDIFLDAWSLIEKKFPSYKPRFYGAGDDLQYFIEKTATLGIDVEFCGRAGDPATVYSDFSLYIAASRSEGFPVAVLEALCCNIPVIASNIEGHHVINSLAKDKGFIEPLILFESENPNDLVDKMEKFLQDPQMYKLDTNKIVSEVFGPELHVAPIESELIKAYRKGCKKRSNLKIIDISDERLFAKNESKNGFFIKRVKADNEIVKDFYSISSGNLLFSEYDNYIVYHYALPNRTSRVSCKVTAECVTNLAHIFVQIDWYNFNNKLLEMTYQSVCVDKKANTFYVMHEPTVKNIKYVDINIRPNPGDKIIIKSLEIKIWK